MHNLMRHGGPEEAAKALKKDFHAYSERLTWNGPDATATAARSRFGVATFSSHFEAAR
jgi:hypothetical protein